MNAHLPLTLSCASVAALALALSPPAVAGQDATAEPRGAEFEQDRKAILAMAGDFRVVFRFKETYALAPDYELKPYYEEHAVETVKVVKDQGDVIVLQHILMPEDSNRIVKHWKQTWHYQDRNIYTYAGDKTWEMREISADAARGSWSQEVSQVDDSPRYEASAKWVHEHNMSYWQSPQIRRPLPRRDVTTRDDYDILMTVNRHTVTPTGWMHEQDNYKQVSATGTVLCREVGMNSYDRDDALDVSRANKYWEETRDAWAMISAQWDAAMAEHHRIALRDEAEGGPLYKQIFTLVKDKEIAADQRAAMAEAILTKFLKREE